MLSGEGLLVDASITGLLGVGRGLWEMSQGDLAVCPGDGAHSPAQA